MRRSPNIAVLVAAGLAVALPLFTACSSSPLDGEEPGSPTVPTASAPGASTTPTSTTTTVAPTSAVSLAPPHGDRYVVPDGEVEREAKQFAVDIARQEKDNASEIFLQWYVTEQVEEEKSADDVIQKLKLMKDAPGGIFMLDREMGARTFTPPAAAE